MILVGSGALFWRAAAHAASAGKTLDAVIHPEGEVVPAWARDLECVATTDVNELADGIDEVTSDQLVCSVGNPFIFRRPILELDLTIVNIHGGPLPQYRGLPIAAAVFAIMQSEKEFGVTLHRVDAGIDTGAIIDRRMFPISDSVTLETLSLQVTEACHEMFTDNLDTLDREPRSTGALETGSSGEYFGMKKLRTIGDHRDHPNFDRATDLGVLAEFYPSYRELFDAARR
ncbi:formyltransferase family protein [Williamsia sp. 1138]|uniref:formyltransferase family protein n=1 Tax=Williamsia sp. 1138 TaxID=1903117 RepID=UPI00143CC407|nr:formyltransferase family protein [Williamsia sp. 1138]